MAIPIVAATLGPLLNFSLPKLWSLIGGGQTKVDVESIITELKFIEALVRDKSRGRGISDVRRVSIEELKLLAFDFEDCIERFVREVRSYGMFISKLKFGGEIRKLKKRSEYLLKMVNDWDTTTEKPACSAQPLVRMGEPLEELRELLLESGSSESERKPKVISIVGFGVLGKTLLAHQVYHDRDVRDQFRLHAWVRAATADAQEVLQEILKQLLENGASTSTDVGQLGGDPRLKNVERLRECLHNERYLIVIDDVLTEELCQILSAFPLADRVDSRIIVTSTIPSEVTRCGCGNGDHTYNKGTLIDEDAKQLFFRKYVSQGIDPSAMLKECDGLPLALVSAADFSHSNGELKKSSFDDEYGTFCAGMKAKMEQVLASNYQSLSSLVLEECLLYFCMFPRDHPVKTNPLIRRWLAEGLIREETIPEGVVYSRLHDVAVHNLQTLIDRNIIQPIQVSNSFRVKRCQPPEMMLDYMYRKSMTHHFITLHCGETKEPDYVRRLSLHPNTAAAELPKNLSRLRTLAVFPTTDLANYGAALKFAEYDLLRVLDLEECDGLNNGHLKKICNLLLLKYLSLGGTIGEVPKEIANLQLLETLDLRRTMINKVPVEVIQLPSLMHLLGKFQLDERGYKGKMKKKLEEFLSADSKLERLSGFVVGDSQGFPQLMSHMVSLKKVKIWCDSSADKANLTHLSIAIKKFVRAGNTSKPCRSLSIDFNECSEEKQFLDSLQAPGSLYSLKLRGKPSKFPQFITGLNTIEELCLSSTNLGPIILARTGNLRGLKFLKVIEDSLILSGHVIQHGQFPRLQRICFSVQTRLELPRYIEDGAMELLLSLQLLSQDLVGSIEIRRLQRLKEVALHARVLDKTKREWQEAAKGHPNWPNVLLIDPPRSRNQDPVLTRRNGTTANRTIL